MGIKELQKYVPNLQLIIQNICKTSVSSFEVLQDQELIDKKLLCWGTYSKELKKAGPVSFYRHIFMGIVIYDRKSGNIFINKTSQNSYKLWKKGQLIKSKTLDLKNRI